MFCYAQFDQSQCKKVAGLLDTFAELCAENLAVLRGFALEADDYIKPGVHPELGQVNLDQLLSTCQKVFLQKGTRFLAELISRYIPKYTYPPGWFTI